MRVTGAVNSFLDNSQYTRPHESECDRLVSDIEIAIIATIVASVLSIVFRVIIVGTYRAVVIIGRWIHARYSAYVARRASRVV